MTTVYMSDIRRAKMCSSGARNFFRDRGLDWMGFLQNGIPAEELWNTGDPMAHIVVEEARRREQAELLDLNKEA